MDELRKASEEYTEKLMVIISANNQISDDTLVVLVAGFITKLNEALSPLRDGVFGNSNQSDSNPDYLDVLRAITEIDVTSVFDLRKLNSRIEQLLSSE